MFDQESKLHGRCISPIVQVDIFEEFWNPFDSGLLDDPSTAERVSGLLKEIWQRISQEDQSLIRQRIGEFGDGLLHVAIIDDWKHTHSTNALFYPDTHSFGLIEIDNGYVSAANDLHVSTTLAHELGHIRGLVNDDLSEETAMHYQRNVWGYPNGQVIYKCECCRRMEEILKTEGGSGQILWWPEHDTFVHLPKNKRLDLESYCDFMWLDDNPRTSMRALLFPDKCRPITIPYAAWENELDEMTRKYLPEDNW